jgi:chitodextrinase
MSSPRSHRLGFVATALGIAMLAPAGATAGGPSRTLEGRLVTYHGDEHGATSSQSRAVWDDTLVTSSGEVRVEFPGARPDGFLNGARVRIRGTQVGETLTAGPGDDDTQVLAAAAPVSGTRKLAVLLVKFSAGAAEPWTPSQARATTFTNANGIASYFAEESYGLLSLTGDVFGWYTISIDTSTCNYLDIGSKARAAATAAGVNLGAYNHIQYAFPKLNACAWSGLAQVPGRDSWINNSLTLRISGHELSHNFGVHHASTLTCSESGAHVALSANPGNCSMFEYGDPFSIMGNAATRHTHNQQLASLGWITGSGLLTITTNGTYTIGAAEDPGALAPRAVRISRGGGEWFYLELRQPYGQYFDNFGPVDPAVLGVSIRLAGDWTAVIQSKLIDTRPATATFDDAPLGIGQTFVDPLSGISITTISAASGIATFTVGPLMDAAPPTMPGNPAVTGTGPTTATFSWSASVDDSGVTGYRVSRNGTVLGTVTGTRYDDTRLAPATQYQYSVVALDAAGRTSEAATAGYTTPPDTTPPTAPTNLRKVKVTSEVVKLAWNAASDAVGVKGYRIYRNGTLIGTTSSLTWTTDRKTKKKTYWVVAYDASGNVGPPSNSVIVPHR